MCVHNHAGLLVNDVKSEHRHGGAIHFFAYPLTSLAKHARGKGLPSPAMLCRSPSRFLGCNDLFLHCDDRRMHQNSQFLSLAFLEGSSRLETPLADLMAASLVPVVLVLPLFVQAMVEASTTKS